MSVNPRVIKTIELLDDAITNKLTISAVQRKFSVGNTYLRDACDRDIHKLLRSNQITKEEYDDIIDKYSNVKKYYKEVCQFVKKEEVNIKKSNDVVKDNIQDVKYDATLDDKYDSRSVGEAVRGEEEIVDNNGVKIKKISYYKYKILIRDSNPLEGTLTRDEMDMICRQYSNLDGGNLTMKNVSRSFQHLTNRDLQRILRAFNITKNSVPVAPHILEEKSVEDISQCILKNKEDLVLKKVQQDRGQYSEKRYNDILLELNQKNNTLKYFEKLIDKYFKNTNITTLPNSINTNKDFKHNEIGYVFFGDNHYGKKYDDTILGRGYNKEIAHERMMQISNDTIKYIKDTNKKKIVLCCLGDILECVMEDGMHAGHTYEMDLFKENQIFYAIDSMKTAVLNILEKTDVDIDFYIIGGNHDRIGIKRDDDKGRTASKIVSGFLKRILEATTNRIDVNIPEQNITKISEKNVVLLFHHGDSKLAGKNPSELVSLYGEPRCYTVILQGHWHNVNVSEHNNCLSIKVPSVASSDNFTLGELGCNSLAGYLIGEVPTYGYGFNFNKITLY